MFRGLAWLTTRLWPLVIAFWVIIAALLTWLAPSWESVAREGNNDYLPRVMTSVRGQELLLRVFPGESSRITLDDVPDVTALAAEMLKLAREIPDGASAWMVNHLDESLQRSLIAGVADGRLLEEEEDALLARLNEFLLQPDFSEQAFGVEPLADSVSYQRQLAARRLLEGTYPGLIRPLPEGQANTRLVLLIERSDDPLTTEDLAAADRLAEQFTPDPLDIFPVVSITTHRTPIIGNQLISEVSPDGGQAVLVVAGIRNELLDTVNIQLLEQIKERVAEVTESAEWPDGLKVWLTGSAVIGGDLVQASAESIANTELWTVILVLAILLFVYRAPLLVIVPLITTGIAVFVSLKTVTLLASFPALGFDVFSTSRIFIIVILFGAGTDFCLFLIARYREELGTEPDRTEALAEAQRQTNPAIVASAMTTILGVSTLWFADFGKYSLAGPTVGVCLIVALLACLTLAPALLQLAGRVVFWPFAVKRLAANKTEAESSYDHEGEAVWRYLADLVLRRPRMVMGLSLLVLGPIAIAGCFVPTSFDFFKELKPDRASVQGTQRLAEYFPRGDIGPLTIVIHRPDGEIDSQEGRVAIAQLTADLYKLRLPGDSEEIVSDLEPPRVSNVRSLAEPIGGTPGRLIDRDRILALRHPKTLDYYLSPVSEYRGLYSRMELVLTTDPFSREAMALTGVLDRFLKQQAREPESFWHGAEFDITGITSTLRDLEAVTSADLIRLRPIVVIVVFAVLVILVRHVIICTYLMGTVLLTYLVTLSVTWLFSFLLFPGHFDGLDWRVPMFLFVILVAVGVDYNIYLVTRVDEEQAALGKLPGLREAAIRTGGIITSCGLIMAGTFSSMTFGWLFGSSGLWGIAELGFALAFGILLDTFVVRTLLVPAFLAWLYGAPEKTAEPEPLSEGDTLSA